jgi:hypothetical protein
MGVDIPDVEQVVHWGAPRGLEQVVYWGSLGWIEREFRLHLQGSRRSPFHYQTTFWVYVKCSSD